MSAPSARVVVLAREGRRANVGRSRHDYMPLVLGPDFPVSFILSTRPGGLRPENRLGDIRTLSLSHQHHILVTQREKAPGKCKVEISGLLTERLST